MFFSIVHSCRKNCAKNKYFHYRKDFIANVVKVVIRLVPSVLLVIPKNADQMVKNTVRDRILVLSLAIQHIDAIFSAVIRHAVNVIILLGMYGTIIKILLHL